MFDTHAALIVAIAAIITFLLKSFPFFVFGTKKTPRFIAYLGSVLPYATMGMLVVYCLKSISFISAPHGIPEFIAIALVALIHIWRRNTLLSILVGTLSYMFMVQFLF